VELFVTWYSCRRALQEVPAELIRPKAPDAGKPLIFERLPIWQKVSFLNKVTIRNIFRYRQRLAMMMVGIGGCTALLVTGFGLRDSIVNVVDYQFQEVTTYDLQVYFDEHQTDAAQTAFVKEAAPYADATIFYHQSSIELEFDHNIRELYLIAADQQVEQVIDFHMGDTPLSMPGVNEVMLSVGITEAMGIDVGDQIVIRNADMQKLDLTVCGIYDNHVENYAIILPETIETQWGSVPEQQMAFLKLREGEDAHRVAASLSELDHVMNVSVSADLADMVSRMMEALDLVVVVVVVCAALLAFTVLYNLTNININERIREIATIKVLGFNASETGAYVFKENMTLTVVGAVLGLFLGNLLLNFVMSQVKIDMVWFKALVVPMSYVWSVVLTILSAVIVDFVFFFKLDTINMAEALKSVE
jgi:putative ABC transport system permease protein